MRRQEGLTRARGMPPSASGRCSDDANLYRYANASATIALIAVQYISVPSLVRRNDPQEGRSLE
jgi:hypothetical protein